MVSKLRHSKWNFILTVFSPGVVGLTVVPIYGWYFGYTAIEIGIFFFYLIFSGLAIIVGYHRLWSHRSFKASRGLEYFLAVLGASAGQGSILTWTSHHRHHHQFSDQPEDLHSPRDGLWHAHFGWLLEVYNRRSDFDNVQDLKSNTVVLWQHKYFVQIILVTSVLIPLCIGYLHGRILGTFLLACPLRMFINYNSVACVNSISHVIGRQNFSRDDDSRDSTFVALLTYGAGYHNYHHRFQTDYRAGIEWWHFDPSKWFIQLCAKLGLAYDLRAKNFSQIEKARLETQLSRYSELSPPIDNIEVDALYDKLVQLLTDINKLEQKEASRSQKSTLKYSQKKYKSLYKHWDHTMRQHVHSKVIFNAREQVMLDQL